jgi:hypothetical protein
MRESLFHELERRLAADPRLTRRGGPRVDLSLLLFNARYELEQLWLEAERLAAGGSAPSLTESVAPRRHLRTANLIAARLASLTGLVSSASAPER